MILFVTRGSRVGVTADILSQPHNAIPQNFSEKYQQGLRVWNRDMTVDPAAIRVVLDASADAKAKSADPNRFFDNALIQAVNREYAATLFPGEVK